MSLYCAVQSWVARIERCHNSVPRLHLSLKTIQSWVSPAFPCFINSLLTFVYIYFLSTSTLLDICLGKKKRKKSFFGLWPRPQRDVATVAIFCLDSVFRGFFIYIFIFYFYFCDPQKQTSATRICSWCAKLVVGLTAAHLVIQKRFWTHSEMVIISVLADLSSYDAPKK